jgi:hypothetical protein
MTHNANVSQTEVAVQIKVAAWPRKVTARLPFFLLLFVNIQERKIDMKKVP